VPFSASVLPATGTVCYFTAADLATASAVAALGRNQERLGFSDATGAPRQPTTTATHHGRPRLPGPALRPLACLQHQLRLRYCVSEDFAIAGWYGLRPDCCNFFENLARGPSGTTTGSRSHCLSRSSTSGILFGGDAVPSAP
jgi:hypothetical protein